MLNLLTSSTEELKAAFNALEGEAFWDRSNDPEKRSTDYSVAGAYRALEERMTWGDLDEQFEEDGSAVHIIYGAGGWNRYAVQVNGNVCFSAFHSTREDAEKATNLGFGPW